MGANRKTIQYLNTMIHNFPACIISFTLSIQSIMADCDLNAASPNPPECHQQNV